MESLVGKTYGILTILKDEIDLSKESKANGLNAIDKELYLKSINNMSNILKDKLYCKCIICGTEKFYPRQKVLNTVYKSCICNLKIVDYTGDTFNGITIMQELGNNEVIASCGWCNSISHFNKRKLIKGETISCGCVKHRNTIKDKIIGNIHIIKYIYKGRDDNYYYQCKCLKCGEDLILNDKEIFTYTCNKEK